MYLGWSEGFHDAGVAVINEKGVIKFATHSERFSGVKHDKYIGDKLRDYIDNNFNISHRAFYEKPLLKRTRQAFAGQLKTAFSPRHMTWEPDSTHFHHLSHAAATFQTSPYEEAAAVVIDSIGEWDTATVWKCRYDKDGYAQYDKKWSMKYPNSIGLWYTALTHYVGLKPLDEEYIFMGMAAFGKRSLKLQMYLNEMMVWQNPNDPMNTNKANLHRGVNSCHKDELGKYNPNDIAYNAQEVLQIKLSHIFTEALKYSDNIVYGGGVALNCVANSQLQRQCNNALWIMPNPGDCGGALGAAALAYGKKVKFNTPYLGYRIKPSSDRESIAERVVQQLLNVGVCGIAYGGAEWGPRALGNRSLLADPRGPEAKDRINKIKNRQLFRPFAPVILEKHCTEYFDMNEPSPYMQFTYNCKVEDLPAIVHKDNSSRVQTVTGSEQGTVMGLVLKKWYAATGCPVLLNTSLNVRGKPMVNDIADAKEFEEKYNVPVIF
jgi:carbamoyltransferase